MMRLDADNKIKIQRTAVTLVIVFYLLVQGLATFLVKNKLFASKTFPFVNYPMYDSHHDEGEHVPVRSVVMGRLDDNTEVEIQDKDLGINYWQYRWGFVNSIMYKDQDEVIKYLRNYNGADWRRFRTVSVMRLPVIITRNSVQLAPLEVVKSVDLAPAKEERP